MQSRHFAKNCNLWLIVGATALGLMTFLSACVDRAPTPARTAHEFRSENGVLTATLDAGIKKVALGPVTLDAQVYNGVYAGPVLRVHPGDLMRITLVNHLTKPTNLHFHGIQTSPLGNSDNVHIVVDPGQSFVYEVRIPKTQPPGLYWYHAHIHHLSFEQVMGGLSGALMVEGFADQYQELKDIRENLMVLKEFTFEKSEDPFISSQYHDRIQTLNGQLMSQIAMRPYETQLWHIANNSADLFINLSIPGHKFRVVAEDGAALAQEEVRDIIRIKPAGRYAVLLDAGEAGTFPIQSSPVPTNSGPERTLIRVLGEIVVAGPPDQERPTIAHLLPGPDLRPLPLDSSRMVTFSEDTAADKYFVDGKTFDAKRIDLKVPLGSLEEWTIRNETDDLHIFHIHQVHFQVVAVNGAPQPFDGYVDTVRIPERGSVMVRLPFTRPEIVGRFMYHCHILTHEDKGMMAQIEIYDPKAKSGSFLSRLLRPSEGSLWGSICRV